MKSNEIYESFVIRREYVHLFVLVLFPLVCLDQLFQHHQYENGLLFGFAGWLCRNGCSFFFGIQIE